MCPPRRSPSPPPLPKARPNAPAPERTASNVVVGSKRKDVGQQKVGEGKRIKANRRRKTLGTDSLRIPVTISSDLRY